MKKLLLILVLVLAFTFPVMAQEEDNWAGEVTIGADYTDGILGDVAKIKFTTEIDEDINAEILLTVNDLLLTTPMAVKVRGKLKFANDEGETAELCAEYKITDAKFYVYGQYLGLPIGDDGILNTKVRADFPGFEVYAVSTLIYNIDEDLELMVEGRADTDGYVPYSVEAQILYLVTDDIDVVIGIELNDWADDINDWDDMEIVDDITTVYAEVVFRF